MRALGAEYLAANRTDTAVRVAAVWVEARLASDEQLTPLAPKRGGVGEGASSGARFSNGTPPTIRDALSDPVTKG